MMKSKVGIIVVCIVALAGIGLVVAKGKRPPPEPPGGAARPSGGAPAPLPPVANPWFEDRAAALGIDFRLGHGSKTPLTVLDIMEAGCAIFDYDGDGHADIFLVEMEGNGSTGHCALYHNNGNGTFTDVTHGSGLEQPGMYMGCAVGDIDNDGKPDLVVTGYGVVRLFRNLGGGKFQDVTKGSGLEAPSPTSWATSAAFADIDHDGKLDLYIGRYVVFNDKTLQFCDYGKFKSSCGPMFYDPQVGSLYRNLGGFKFKDVTTEYGLDAAHGKCLGVAFADVNGDGWPDLYLGNDEMPGDLFINEGGKHFHEAAVPSGLALSGDARIQGAMGVDFGDFNRDGLLDLVVTTFEFEPSSLYLAAKDGIFQYASISTGFGPATAPLVGFGTKFVDLDNDGWLDIPIANGHIHDNQNQIDRFSQFRQPMQLFMNEGGKKLVEHSHEAGPGFTTPGVGRGLAVGDLNDDGLMDIVICDHEGPTRVLINKMPNKNKWLRVTLRGTTSNRMGIGARVTVVAGQERWVAECTAGGSYLSASDSRLHFGLGQIAAIDRVEVRWPGGKRSVVKSPKIPGDLTIQEP